MPYIVKHNCLGMGPGKDKYQGDIVTEAELESAGADIERLLELGAIAETGCSGCDIDSECGECEGQKPEEEESDEVDIENLGTKQLIELASQMGLELTSAQKRSKAALIEAITESMVANTEI